MVILRPYLFLRDTAKIEDLKMLLKDNHPYIRIYSFAALVHRKQDSLFQHVVNNLTDTTRIEQLTGHVGSELYPADLMISYSIKQFNKIQKDSLKKLILYKYNHLITMNDVMLFHRPMEKDYQQVRRITKRKDARKAFRYADTFNLVALSRYRNKQDVDLIMTGFDVQYYNGVKLFFKAIEEFPSLAFKPRLLKYGEQFGKIDLKTSLSGEEYFLSSLAAFHDVDCFNFLLGITDQLILLKGDQNEFRDSKTENLQIVYNALKRHPDSMNKDLMKKIEKQIHKKDALLWSGYEVENSIWDY